MNIRAKKESQPKISFHIDPQLKEAFDQWCSDRDLDMSTVLRGWIDNRDLIGIWIKENSANKS